MNCKTHNLTIWGSFLTLTSFNFLLESILRACLLLRVLALSDGSKGVQDMQNAWIES